MPLQILHIHLASDSTGETVHQVARACLAQFTGVKIVEHVWTLVRSEAHLDALFAGLDRYPGIIDEHYRSRLTINNRKRVQRERDTNSISIGPGSKFTYDCSRKNND